MADTRSSLLARLLAVASLLAAPPAGAATSGVYSDLWWVPEESGWGIGIHQQGAIIFATLFVYDQDRRPTWFVAPNLLVDPGCCSPQPFPDHTLFRGELYQVSGPWFGGTYSPGNVTPSRVGTASLFFFDPYRASLTYETGGVQVVKQIQRQTFSAMSLTGTYRGSLVRGCGSPPTISGRIVVSQNGSEFALDIFHGSPATNCRYSGTYSQSGRIGRAEGTHYCVLPGGGFTAGGTFLMTGIEQGVNGFHARMYGTDESCDVSGTISGAVDNSGLP